MSRREKPLHEQMVVFCRHHLGKHCFAPLTGGDWPLWTAFCYLLQAHAHGGGKHALAAMQSTLAAAQHTEPVLQVFVQTVAGVLDWTFVAQLWPQIASDVVIKGKLSNRIADGRLLCAIERSEFYTRDSKVMQERTRAWGWHSDPRKDEELDETRPDLTTEAEMANQPEYSMGPPR